ncbi:recombination regulator RecX [Halomonas shantousis]
MLRSSTPSESTPGESTPRDDAIRLLGRREYSRAELMTRLRARGHESVAINEALDALAEQGLQSDTRFAEVFVRSRIMRGQGPVKIRAELGARGIDSSLIAMSLEAVEVDWQQLACETLARRFDGPGQGPRERARRERFLAGRGFDFSQVRYALGHAWS